VLCSQYAPSSSKTPYNLVLPDDPPEYEALLKGTICGASAVPVGKEFYIGSTAVGTQQEAIDRVLAEISRRDRGVGEGRNVLISTCRVSPPDIGYFSPVISSEMFASIDYRRLTSTISPSTLRDQDWRIGTPIVPVLYYAVYPGAFSEVGKSTFLFISVILDLTTLQTRRRWLPTYSPSYLFVSGHRKQLFHAAQRDCYIRYPAILVWDTTRRKGEEEKGRWEEFAEA
jgi:hypothetical protein